MTSWIMQSLQNGRKTDKIIGMIDYFKTIEMTNLKKSAWPDMEKNVFKKKEL